MVGNLEGNCVKIKSVLNGYEAVELRVECVSVGEMMRVHVQHQKDVWTL